MTLQAIADIIGYKDHASPYRDKHLVATYLDIDKAYAKKYKPVLEAAAMLDAKMRQKEEKGIPESGDLCWFWNSYSRFPIIGTFERSYINEDNEQRFVSRELPTRDYSSCVYAGNILLPDQFSEPIRFSVGPFYNQPVCIPSLIS